MIVLNSNLYNQYHLKEIGSSTDPLNPTGVFNFKFNGNRIQHLYTLLHK